MFKSKFWEYSNHISESKKIVIEWSLTSCHSFPTNNFANHPLLLVTGRGDLWDLGLHCHLVQQRLLIPSSLQEEGTAGQWPQCSCVWAAGGLTAYTVQFCKTVRPLLESPLCSWHKREMLLAQMQRRGSLALSFKGCGKAFTEGVCWAPHCGFPGGSVSGSHFSSHSCPWPALGHHHKYCAPVWLGV